MNHVIRHSLTFDRWRYHYPEFDTSGQWHKVVPSQALSDMLVDALKEQ